MSTENPQLKNENEILPYVYGAIISQKSQADYLKSFPINTSKQNILQFILSVINYGILTIFFPYKSMLNNTFISKAYWIGLIVVSAYLIYYITLMFPIKNKLYVSSVIKAWIIMFAVLIYFMYIS
jgi:hypothetical protein